MARRRTFDWDASMNTMLGYTPGRSAGVRTGLVIAYEAAMDLPVRDLDAQQLGRLWDQSPNDAMIEMLVPTTIAHLHANFFLEYGTAAFDHLVRKGLTAHPEYAPALSALLVAWASRLVEVLRDLRMQETFRGRLARSALEAAGSHPAAMIAFQEAYQAQDDHEGVGNILWQRARRAATPSERVALLVERAHGFERALDLVAAEHAWLDVIEVAPSPRQACDELLRLFRLDPAPPWILLVESMKHAARHVTGPERAELLRRAADLAATELDDPDQVRAILDAL